MKLILVRHGETLWNKEIVYQGHLDSPLTEKGLKEAKLIANELRKEKIDLFYSSPLGRALATGKEINKFHKIKPILRDGLKEIKYGEFEGKSLKEIDEQNPEWKIERKTNRYFAKPTGGESYAELEERLKPLIEEILKKRDCTVLIVAHANVNKAIIRLILNLDKEEINYFYQPNNCIYFIEKKGKGYELSYKLAGEGIEGEGYLEIE